MNEQRLAVGDQVPHFTLHTADGQICSYSAIWQVKNLVLVVLPSQATGKDVQSRFQQPSGLDATDTQWVVTRERVPGLVSPAALVADKWGEIVHVVHAPNDLPALEDLAEWVEHVRQRCPECEGEAR